LTAVPSEDRGVPTGNLTLDKYMPDPTP